MLAVANRAAYDETRFFSVLPDHILTFFDLKGLCVQKYLDRYFRQCDIERLKPFVPGSVR